MDNGNVAGEPRGRSVVVTGAGRGIGRAVVERLARTGWRVVGVEVNEKARDELCEVLGADRVVIGDASDRDVIAQAVAVARRHAPLGGWVSNAAAMGESALHAADAASVTRILQVNLIGALWGAIAAVQAFLEQESDGAIVNVTSSQARACCSSGNAAYQMSKAAIEALTRNLAVEYGPVGIRANSVAPGGVDTPLNRAAFSAMPDPAAALAASERSHPLGRIARADEIAAAIAFLLSPDASFITGATIAVDGGLTAKCVESPVHPDLDSAALAYRARLAVGRQAAEGE